MMRLIVAIRFRVQGQKQICLLHLSSVEEILRLLVSVALQYRVVGRKHLVVRYECSSAL